MFENHKFRVRNKSVFCPNLLQLTTSLLQNPTVQQTPEGKRGIFRIVESGDGSVWLMMGSSGGGDCLG